MRTVSIVSRKGGAGKTTLAVHLALAAHLRGLKTVLADADPQRSASEALRLRKATGPRRVETSGPKLFALQIAAARAGDQVLVIDTPCGPEPDVSDAIALADLVLIVMRPTFLDIAASVRTVEAARRLGRPAQILLNQACSLRGGAEPDSVRKAIEALRFTNMALCPVIVRSRALFQTVLSAGLSVEEIGPSAAASEIEALWRHVEQQAPAEPLLKRA
jgi:chromosome partitioning protein